MLEAVRRHGLKRCRTDAHREGLLEARTELCLFASALFGVQLPHFCVEIKLIKCKVLGVLLDKVTPVLVVFCVCLIAIKLRVLRLKFNMLYIRHLRSVSCFL